jgi:hypothetical protein
MCPGLSHLLFVLQFPRRLSKSELYICELSNGPVLECRELTQQWRLGTCLHEPACHPWRRRSALQSQQQRSKSRRYSQRYNQIL